MTTEEKLIALGFKKSIYFDSLMCKELKINNILIQITFHTLENTGTISNVRECIDMSINSFKELLRLNDFYEKQSRRSESRNASGNGSQTQNDVQRA